MDAFAGYNVLRELRRDHLGRVLLVEPQADGGAQRVIRTCEPPQEMSGRAAMIAAFLDRAAAQRAIVEGGAQRWAPIHDVQEAQDGAYLVSDYYARTGEWLTQASRVAGPVLFAMICSMLEGLQEAQTIAKRPHGDLTLPKLMLVNTRGDLHLSDPLESDKAARLTAADDLRRAGELVYRLIFNQTYTTVRGLPPADAPQWKELDPKRAAQWHEFVVRLLDPSLASSEPQIDQVLADFRKQVTPPSQTGKRVAIAAAAALLLTTPFVPLLLPECHPIRAAIPFYAPNPDPQKWQDLCDAHEKWLGQLYVVHGTDFDVQRRKRWADAGLGPVIDELDRVRDAGIELSPPAISGNTSMYSVLRKQVPADAAAICHTKEAEAAARRLAGLLRAWPKLDPLRQKVSQYRAAGWPSLGQHLERLIDAAAPKTGLDAPQVDAAAPKTGVDAPRVDAAAPKTGVDAPKVDVAAGVETVMAITAQSGEAATLFADVDRSLQQVAAGMKQLPSDALRERFGKFANAYLDAVDGQGVQFLNNVDSRMERLQQLLGSTAVLAGHMDRIEHRITTARDEMRATEVADKYEDAYRDAREDVLAKLSQAKADAGLFADELTAAGTALKGVESDYEDRFAQAPQQKDPRLDQWVPFRDDLTRLPEIADVDEKIKMISAKYQDRENGQLFEGQLKKLTQDAADLLALSWTWEHKDQIERGKSRTTAELTELNKQVTRRLASLAKPIDTFRPTDKLVERVAALRGDMGRLERRDEEAFTEAMTKLIAIDAEVARLHELEWVEAFRKTITDGAAPLEQRLGELESHVFVRLDPRQDTNAADRLAKVQQQLSTDPAKRTQFGAEVTKLAAELTPLLNEQATPWTPDNRDQIEQNLARIEGRLAKLASDIFPDPRDGWQWRESVAGINRAIQFRKQTEGDAALTAQQQQALDAALTAQQQALDAMSREVQQALLPPWPQQEAAQTAIRQQVEQYKQRFSGMFAELDPRKQWTDGQQWIDKIAPLAASADPQQVPNADQYVQQFAAARMAYTELMNSTEWSLQTQKQVQDKVAELRLELPRLYNALNPDPRSQYDLMKLADAVDSEIALARGADPAVASRLSNTLATVKQDITTLLKMNWQKNEQQVRDGVRDQLAALRTTLADTLRLNSMAPGSELDAMHESWRTQRDHLITRLAAPDQVGTLLDRVRLLRSFYAELDQALPTGLPPEIEGQQVRMPTTVELAVVAQVVRRRREVAAADVLSAFAFGEQDLMPGVPQDKRETAVTRYEQWRQSAGRMAIDFRRIERLLDDAYGYTETVPGAAGTAGESTTVAALFQRWEGDGPGAPVFADFREALGGVLKRIDGVNRVSKLADRNELALIAQDTQGTGPALLMSAWRRLGQLNDPAWPASLDELKLEGAIRQRLLDELIPRVKVAERRAVLAAELDRQGPQRWRTAFTRLPVDQTVAIEEAAAPRMLDRFNVKLDALRGEVQFNVALAQLRLASRSDAGSDQQIDEQVSLFIERVGKMPDGVNQKEQPKALLSELEQLRAGGRTAEAAVVRAGPAMMTLPSWREKSRSPDGRTITYDWLGRSRSHELTFVRVDPPTPGDKPFYMATREVPLGLFIDVIEVAGQKAVFKQLMPLPESKGPRVWAWNDASASTESQLRLGVNPTWTDTGRTVPELIGVQIYAPGVDGGSPSVEHPMHVISPEGAAWFARLLGCRLPSSGEWQAALLLQRAGRTLDDYIDATRPNLRDKTWLTQVEHIDGLSRQGNQVSGLSPFDKTEWSKKKQNLSHWTYDDGVLWFDRVDRGPEPFQHLVGNVAEYVVDGTDPLADLAPGQLPAGQALPLLRQRLAAAKKVSIIGGSAQWPQSVAHDQAQDVDWQKKDFGGNLLAAGFSDVGIRLAYTQPSDPLVLRLRKLLEARPYLPMPVVGAAAGAGDGP